MRPEPEKAKPPELGGHEGVSGEGPTEVGLLSAADLGRTVDDYGSRKRRTNAVAEYLGGTSGQHLARRLFACATWLRFRWWLDHDRVTLNAAKFCQLPLLCPNCARRRAAKQGAKVEEKLLHLAPSYDYWFITLTVKNGHDLAERFNHLSKSFKTMRRLARDHLKGTGRFVELARAQGLLWSFEFTKSDHGWHPHVHMIAALPKGSEPIRWGVEQVTGEVSQLRLDWESVTGDSTITHAEPVTMDNPRAGIAELVKYALKFSDLTVADTAHAYWTLRGRKLTECSGVMRGVVLPEDLDLLDDELTGAYMDLLYRWHGQSYSLADTTSGAGESVLESRRITTPGAPHGTNTVGGNQGQPHA